MYPGTENVDFAPPRAGRRGRPRVSQQPVKEVIMAHISTSTAAVGTQ